MANDISEEFQVDLGNPSAFKQHTNTSIMYDVAIDGMPFVLFANDQNPYIRQTAEYRKQQFDNTNEAGEQSLSGWWLRSQSSFHYGSGINFYEPAQADALKYRFADSQGVDPWTIGQVTLLNDVDSVHTVTSTTRTLMRSIKYGTTNAVLLHDGYDVDKITSAGAEVHFIDYNAGTSEAVYAICDDGVNAYWVTNAIASAANKLHMFKKPLTGDSTTGSSYPTVTGDVTKMFDATGTVVANAVMEWVKGRIIACINNGVYELTSASSALPTAIFTAPTGTIFTGITASASDIYLSARLGDSSLIYRLPLDTDGTFTSLSTGVVVAEMPRGEIVWSIDAYLGYMAIGTSRGVRIAQLLDNGGVVYGPLLFQTSQPVYQFAAQDKFVWAACGVGTDVGLVRIDLSQQYETLRFAYANDLQASGVTRTTGGVAFMNGTNQLAFTSLNNGTSDGSIYVENESVKRTSGYITTGKIRYNTIEDKFFKYVRERAEYPGTTTIDISTIDRDGTELAIFESDANFGNRDIGVKPASAQEFMSFKFTLNRDATTTSLDPTFYGYQIKAQPAAAKQRLIQYNLLCYDEEMDRLKNKTGYEGRAMQRVMALESVEEASDVVNVQDLRTDESFTAQIENMSFRSVVSSDRRFSGFGGLITITVRKL